MMIINLTLHYYYPGKAIFCAVCRVVVSNSRGHSANSNCSSAKEKLLEIAFFEAKDLALSAGPAWSWGQLYCHGLSNNNAVENQTNSPPIAIIGNKPAVTFNCIIPVFDFTILFLPSIAPLPCSLSLLAFGACSGVNRVAEKRGSKKWREI